MAIPSHPNPWRKAQQALSGVGKNIRKAKRPNLICRTCRNKFSLWYGFQLRARDFLGVSGAHHPVTWGLQDHVVDRLLIARCRMVAKSKARFDAYSTSICTTRVIYLKLKLLNILSTSATIPTCKDFLEFWSMHK